MFLSNRILKIIFSLILLWIIAIPVRNARAEDVLSALSQAYRTDYRETRKLGAHPTPEQVRSVHEKAYAHFRQLAAAEMTKRNHEFFDALNQIGADLKKKIALKSKKQKGNTVQDEQLRLPNASRKVSSTTTGVVTGSDGAKKLEIKNSPSPKAPTVIDGIIQER